MWQIYALLNFLHNAEVKRPPGRARHRREIVIKIDLKRN
jgi:hypothetical protein